MEVKGCIDQVSIEGCIDQVSIEGCIDQVYIEGCIDQWEVSMEATIGKFNVKPKERGAE